MKKKHLLYLLLLVNSVGFAQARSLSLYSETHQRGNYIDFIGELTVKEKGLRDYDHLLPVAVNNASSAEVSPGYCAILADGDFFSGEWNVLSPGAHDTISSMDNRANSVATYKMIRPGQNFCNVKSDIPVLYDGSSFNGAQYPLIFKEAGASLQPEDNFEASTRELDRESLSSQHVRKKRKINERLSDNYRAGGFSFKASSLSVPECYSVTLTKIIFPSGRQAYHESKTFGVGQFSLSSYGYSNNTVRASITRNDSCSNQPVVTDFIRYVFKYGDWLYKEWDALPLGNSYEVVVEATSNDTGERREFRQVIQGSTDRGNFLYHYEHKDGICNGLGYGHQYSLERVSIRSTQNSSYSDVVSINGQLDCPMASTLVRISVTNFMGSGSLSVNGQHMCNISSAQNSTCSTLVSSDQAIIKFSGENGDFVGCDSRGYRSCTISLNGGQRNIDLFVINFGNLGP